jgi:hypothetical protein
MSRGTSRYATWEKLYVFDVAIRKLMIDRGITETAIPVRNTARDVRFSASTSWTSLMLLLWGSLFGFVSMDSEINTKLLLHIKINPFLGPLCKEGISVHPYLVSVRFRNSTTTAITWSTAPTSTVLKMWDVACVT